MDLEEEYEEKSWSKKLLGKDISQVPCLENTFLCGFTTGAFTGLANFLYTSRGRLSFHVGFGTYLLTCLVYWVHCRYKYELNQQKLRSLFDGKVEESETGNEGLLIAIDKNENKEIKD